MVWWLILLCLAVVISPLMWMKNSPRQQRIKRFRDLARTLSIKVSLQRRPEARETESRLDSVCYWRPWNADIKVKSWVLHRHSQRGWPSPWQGWHWFQAEAGTEWSNLLTDSLQILPEGVTAIVINNSGVGLIWNERGEDDTVETIKHSLDNLIEKGKEIYL